MKNTPLRSSIALLLSISLSLMLCSCTGGQGVGGGLVQGVIHEGVYQDCDHGAKKTSAKGKEIEVDGVLIKMPIDWNYANTNMSGSFNGANWEGDSAARGIGIFNANEEGDGSETYRNSYSINMRWEYITYGSVKGVYDSHASYKGTDSTGTYNIGGTDESCVSGKSLVNSKINKDIGNFISYLTALSKCKILIYYPKTGKACVAQPGFYATGQTNVDSAGFNWGGAPLACMGGFSEAVGNALSSTGKDWAELQPRPDDCPIVEMYFADPDSPVGPCEFDGASVTSPGSGSSGGLAAGSSDLSQTFKEIAESYSGTYSIYAKAADGSWTGGYNESNKQKSASMIKVPILGTMLDKVSKGEFKLEDSVYVSDDEIVGGTGTIQNSGAGEYTYGELARLMITVSDNTATNKIINKIGMDSVNSWAKSNGCENTELNRFMLTEGTENYTSAKDIVTLMDLIANDKFVNSEMSSIALEYLNGQTDSNGVGLGLNGMKYGHKTGTLSDVFNDGGIAQGETTFSVCVLGDGGSLDEKINCMRAVGNALVGSGDKSSESSNSSSNKKCHANTSNGGNSSIAEAAVTVAYDPNDRGKYKEEDKGCGYDSECDSSAIVGYFDLCKSVNLDHGGTPYVCECSTLTPVAVRWAGADDTITTFTDNIIDHCEASDHWQNVGTLFSDKQVEDLQPGDILVNHDHTWVFCGNEEVQKKFPDSSCDCVSASLTGHAPEIETASHYNYKTWNIYRNVKAEEDSKYKDVKLESVS